MSHPVKAVIRLLVALMLVGGYALGGAVVPVHAATWDGVNPRSSSCWNDRRFVQSTHLRYAGSGGFAPPIIYLYYSPSCRTTWARLTGGTIPEPGNSSGGYAIIHRNSDGREFRCSVVDATGECITPMVNDANVTSYAFGFEDAGAWTAWGRTASF